MKRILLIAIVLLLSLSPYSSKADSPIYTGLLWDTAPSVAYNSRDGEFLVVWNMYNYLFPFPDVRFFGPLMGQLYKESGEKAGEPFVINTAGGVVPDVVYNESTHEYLVVTEQSYNTMGQRVSALGIPIGAPTLLISDARNPRVLYNSLTKQYLVAGIRSTATGCDFYTVVVGSSGAPSGPVHLSISQVVCGSDTPYAIAFAPISTPKTPQGRFLVGFGSAKNLYMLNDIGESLQLSYDPHVDRWSYGVPFEKDKIGSPVGIDIAYGVTNGDSDFTNDKPAFFIVWGDLNKWVMQNGENIQWTGIWSGLVDAEADVFDITHASNDVFPISMIHEHWATQAYAEEWSPRVVYNPAAKQFIITWRETPAENPLNMTNVNHIRANTSQGYKDTPLQNLIISSTSGTENPTFPCIGSSTKTAACLIAWEDHRGFGGNADIYGSFLNASSRTPSNSLPPGPASEKSYWKLGAGGNFHSLGIYQDSSPSNTELMAWGYNDYGQLGIGNTINQTIPKIVSPLPPCLECSDDQVVLNDVTFPPYVACECKADTSVTIGSGTTVEDGAVVRFIAPNIRVQSGAKFKSGSDVGMKQQ